MASCMTLPADSTANFSSESDYATFRHARQEAFLILIAWAVALLWSVTYCYLTGFTSGPHAIDPNAVPLLFGIPRWVFWGIAFPWLIADVFTIWLCFFYMQDDDLGEAREGADIAEDRAELHAVHPKETNS